MSAPGSEIRAKISDRAERCWSYYDGDQGAGAALAEVRELLAEHEPDVRDRQGWPLTTWQSSMYLNAKTLTHMTALSEAQASLAEALAAFVGGF